MAKKKSAALIKGKPISGGGVFSKDIACCAPHIIPKGGK